MTSVSKHLYTNNLAGIVDKYNNTYHSTTKMKPANVKSSILTSIRKIRGKILNLELLIMIEYQHIKTFLKKVTLQIGLKKFLLFKNLKILCLGHMLLVILTVKELLERFIKKN